MGYVLLFVGLELFFMSTSYVLVGVRMIKCSLMVCVIVSDIICLDPTTEL